jgi:uncharacterized small protein (DUF1192 family)
VEEPVSTRVMRGHYLQELAREDLEAYGAEELRERVQQLRDEIDRTESQLKRKLSGLAAADALFKPRS